MAGIIALGSIAFSGTIAQAIPQAATSSSDDAGYSFALLSGGETAPLLTVQGNWPTPCAPTFQGASLSGNDLRIDARTMLNLCAHASTPFSITIDPALAAGQAALAPGIYHVSFYAADGMQGAPQLRAFGLLDTAASASVPFKPENGFWWTTSATHQSMSRNVFSLELQGSQLTAALMSYDHDGHGDWQFGTAQLDGRIAHVPLLQIAGGSAPFAAAAAATPRGEAGLTLDLEFHSGAHASAWLTRTVDADDPRVELQAMELVRLPFADAGGGSAWKGDWVLLTDADDAAPLRLHLDRLTTLNAYRFRLSDDRQGVIIDCTLDGSNVELPPQNCNAHRHDGGDIGHFDAVAIGRMDGTRGDGAGVHLLRVTP
jgi:hypothetical protein